MCWLDAVQRFKDSFGWSLSLTLLKILKMEFCRISIFLCADSNSFMPLQACCRFDYFSWGLMMFNIKINIFIPLSDPLLDILEQFNISKNISCVGSTLFYLVVDLNICSKLKTSVRQRASTSQGLWSVLNHCQSFFSREFTKSRLEFFHANIK